MHVKREFIYYRPPTSQLKLQNVAITRRRATARTLWTLGLDKIGEVPMRCTLATPHQRSGTCNNL
jgi:hypothetical protein